MAPLPLLKLGLLAVRQVMKPVTARVTREAKERPVFRRFVILPMAQLYHRLETTAKMLLLGFGKPMHVEPLSEKMAIELGSSILSEGMVFSVAAGLMVFEYNRAAASSAAKERQLQDRLIMIEARLQDVSFQVERQKAMIRELEHGIAWSTSPLAKLRQILPGRGSAEDKDNNTEPAPHSPSQLATAVRQQGDVTSERQVDVDDRPQRSLSEPSGDSLQHGTWQRVVHAASQALGIDSFSSDFDIDADGDEVD